MGRAKKIIESHLSEADKKSSFDKTIIKRVQDDMNKAFDLIEESLKRVQDLEGSQLKAEKHLGDIINGRKSFWKNLGL